MVCTNPVTRPGLPGERASMSERQTAAPRGFAAPSLPENTPPQRTWPVRCQHRGGTFQSSSVSCVFRLVSRRDGATFSLLPGTQWARSHRLPTSAELQKKTPMAVFLNFNHSEGKDENASYTPALGGTQRARSQEMLAYAMAFNRTRTQPLETSADSWDSFSLGWRLLMFASV